MQPPEEPSAAAPDGGVNRISPLRFIVGFGIVSALADVVYEGARSIIGPYLGSLGASAAVVGVITGAGEAAALVLRLFTGRLADRLGKPWPQTVLGYALTALCVPLLAVAGGLVSAGLLYNGERVGKAVRTPARDSMLAHASAEMGRGYAFGLHEALDQIGAMAGPLLIALTLALGGHYRLAFALLGVPGVLALVALARLRRRAPDPAQWEPAARVSEKKNLRLEAGLSKRFWQYAAFSAATMLGFSTWAVLAFHLTSRHLASPSLVPVLSFSSSTALFVAGAVIWGAGMGIHDSTMRAAVADFVPATRRGAGYGTFTAVYGLAWLVGASVIGLLYEHSTGAAVVFIAVVQAVALILLVPLVRSPAA